MTNDELERAIDFLLKSQANSQANFDAQMELSKERHARISETLARLAERDERLAEKHERLAEQVSSFADTQAVIMQVMTRTLESQDETNKSLRAAVRDLASEQKAGDEALRQSLREMTAERIESENALRRSMKEGDDALRESMGKMAEALATLVRKVEELADAQQRRDANP